MKGLNMPIKQQRLSESVIEQDPTTCYIQKNKTKQKINNKKTPTYFQYKACDKLKVK